MKLKRILSILGLVYLTIGFLSAQFAEPWQSLSSIRKNTFAEKIEISPVNLQRLHKNQSFLSFTHSVKLSNVPQTSAMIPLLNQWPDIAELYLNQSGFDLSKKDFESLVHIEHVILECSSADTQIINNVSYIPNVEKITLILTDRPDAWDFLYYYQKIKKLHLYGDFSTDCFYPMLEKLQVFHELIELGLSINFATDISRNLHFVTSLKSLKLYDNQSRLNYQNLGHFRPEMFNITGLLPNDQPTELSVYYYAEDFGLTVKEIEHLRSIYINGTKIPYMPLMASSVHIKSTENFKQKINPIFHSPSKTPPLLEGIYPEAEVFNISHNSSVALHTKCGVNIIFNNNHTHPFVTMDGSPFEGDVFVSFRPMRDMLNMAFRGLDLRVAKTASSPMFKSSFAFELELSDGMFPLQLREGVKIQMEMPVLDSIQTLYYQDPQSQIFMEYNTYKWMEQIDESKTTFAVTSSQLQHEYQIDVRNATLRFQNPDNYFLNDKDVYKQWYIPKNGFYVKSPLPWETHKPHKDQMSVRAGRKLIHIRKIKNPKGQKQDVFFQLNDKSGLFNEVKTLAKFAFKFKDTLSSKEFSSAFVRNKVYHDIIILKHSDKLEIILKSTEGYHSIFVESQLFTLSGKPLKQKKNQRVLSGFFSIAQKRYDLHEVFIKEKLQSYESFYRKRQLDWSNNHQMTRFDVWHTGIFGLMEVGDKPPSESYHMTYNDLNGIPIDVKKLTVLDIQHHQLRQINKGNVYLNPETTSLLLCVDFKGNLYYIKGEQLRGSNITPGGVYYIRLNNTDGRIRSVREFSNDIKFDRIK
jgi:hypothetical protein